MSRSVPWRRTCTDAVSWRQDQASNTTIYILRNLGPTSVLLKEEGEDKNFKVFLGDPHRCTCSTFMKEHDLCKHICWVLLKKFRVPRTNPITWQLGLVEREINEVLKGTAASQNTVSNRAKILAKQAHINTDGSEDGAALEPGALPQRPINEEDVCPICQEELLSKRLPVTYCKFGCGNNIHIKCMMVWAEHNRKSSNDSNITCPLCREDFGPYNKLLQQHQNTTTREPRGDRTNQHFGITCRKCHTNPIVGKCYKCIMCSEYHLCQKCFVDGTHREHEFQFREKSNQRWRTAQRGSGGIIPDAIVNSLQNRDISEQDYDMLLQLDSSSSQQLSDLTEEMVRFIPMERIRHNSVLLAPGRQCRICLRPYQEGQHVRRLPCKHKFHKDCIDNWLLHQHPTCPVDGSVYTPEGIRQMKEASRLKQQEKRNTGSGNSVTRERVSCSGPALELGGIAITRVPTNNPSHVHRKTSTNTGSRNSTVTNNRNETGQVSGFETDVGITVSRIVGYTHSHASDEDHIDSVLAANITSPSPISHAASLRAQNLHNPDSPASLRRNSFVSTASETDSTSLLDRSYMPPIEIPYDLSGINNYDNLNTLDYPPNEDNSVNGPRDVSSGGGAQRIRGHRFRDETESYSSISAPSSGEQSRTSSGQRRTSGVAIEVTPVNPSIPLSRTDVDIRIGLPPSPPAVHIEPAPPLGAVRKPPTGYTGHGSQRRGRLRSKPIADPASRRTSSNSDRRIRSSSREREPLFIGHDPSGTQRFISEYSTRISCSSVHRGSSQRRGEGRGRSFDQSENRYRWGNTQEFSGASNDIVLSGNRLANMHM